MQNPWLVGKLMDMLVQNLLSTAIAAVVIEICIRTSAVLVPSLGRVAPKYLKLVTSFSSTSFMGTSALGLVCAIYQDLRILRADRHPKFSL
ncbi:hypothetical protein DPMN_097944 [Dreissena polymorpha]|uniref:Uncharacterized protein n=1 Tax=Dreissena polymorpha TaxID=45954 RepID=A0A9D4R669_DREPO|nr:hypothetical protein DPMN_097944 [Dreissena polymorpha]